MKSEHRHELKTNELERIASDWGHASERYVQTHTNQLHRLGGRPCGDRDRRHLLADVGRLVRPPRLARPCPTPGRRPTMEPWPTNMPERRSPPGLGFARGKRSFPAAFVCSSPIATRGDPTCKRPKRTSRSSSPTKSSTARRSSNGLSSGWRGARNRCRRKTQAPRPSTIRPSKTYERLLKEFPDTVYKQLAESRIAALRTGTAQDFNAWFETQNPETGRPRDAQGSQHSAAARRLWPRQQDKRQGRVGGSQERRQKGPDHQRPRRAGSERIQLRTMPPGKPPHGPGEAELQAHPERPRDAKSVRAGLEVTNDRRPLL